MNDYVPQIINAILQQGTVHYSDIERITGKSKKTIVKYLNEVQSAVQEYGVELIRKSNVGIYFEGNIQKLSGAMGDGALQDNRGTKEQRQLSLTTKLLLAKGPQTIQDLADTSFVSRSTFEADLKAVRMFLEEHKAKLHTSQNGIQVIASERVRRRLMAELLNMYWGQPTYLDNRRQATHERIRVPSEINQFFSSKTLDKVLKSLDEFEAVTGTLLSDYEYQSLAIHLVIAIERISRNEMLQGIAEHVTLEPGTVVLTAIIERDFNLTIPKDESQYLNIHILAAEENTTDQNEKKSNLSSSLQENEISAFLRANLKQFDETLIRNLTLHLVPALKRISLGLKLRNPYTEDTKRFFPLAYNRAVDLGFKIKDEFNIDLNDDELAFIALHIEALIERTERKTTAVLVCSTGLGTARLLEQRMKKYFANQIDIRRVVSVQELKRAPVNEDMVVSTITLANMDKPVIVVPPFLDTSSINRITEMASGLNQQKSNATAFLRLLKKRLITFENRPMEKEEAIRTLGDQIERAGFGKHGISDAAVQRESLASTAITSVAVPHAPIEFVQSPCIAILVNPVGIRWESHTVKVVFFLAMNKEIKPNIDQVYRYFNEILEDQRLLSHLERATSPEEAIEILGGDLND